MSDKIQVFSPTVDKFIDIGTEDEEEIDKIRKNLLDQGVFTWIIYT